MLAKLNYRRRRPNTSNSHRISVRRAASLLGGRLQTELLEDRRMMAVDVILEWNDVLLAANAADHARSSPEAGGPILTARAFAIVSAAMYDAYNSVNRIGEEQLVKPLGIKGADVDAAVAQAAYTTLYALYPSQRRMFKEALDDTLDRVRNGKGEMLGRAVGTYVGLRYLVDHRDDGAMKLANNTYVYNGLPGFHKADPLHPNQGYYASSAMDVDPMVVESLDQFAARRLDDGTPEGRIAFMQSEEYRLAYEELLELGGDGDDTSTERTEEQTQIGIYWGYDGRPGLGTPPRLYNQIARTVAEQEENSEAENARLFALVNIAMYDAGLTSWKNKYDDAFWRPIMGIRKGDIDGNPATPGIEDWTPLGAPASNPRPGETNFTPPFPAYTSGHATFGAAAFQILTRFYGRDDIEFTFVSDELNDETIDADGTVRPLVPRTFESFTEAKLENAQSRIYLGIHWAFDRDDGVRSGDNVANYVFENALRPIQRSGSRDLFVGRDDTTAAPHTTVPRDSEPRRHDAAQKAPVDAAPLLTSGQTASQRRPNQGASVDRVMRDLGDEDSLDAM